MLYLLKFGCTGGMGNHTFLYIHIAAALLPPFFSKKHQKPKNFPSIFFKCAPPIFFLKKEREIFPVLGLKFSSKISGRKPDKNQTEFWKKVRARPQIRTRIKLSGPPEATPWAAPIAAQGARGFRSGLPELRTETLPPARARLGSRAIFKEILFRICSARKKKNFCFSLSCDTLKLHTDR